MLRSNHLSYITKEGAIVRISPRLVNQSQGNRVKNGFRINGLWNYGGERSTRAHLLYRAQRCVTRRGACVASLAPSSNAKLRRHPILHLQSLNTCEFTFVVGNQYPAFSPGMRGEPQVVVAYGLALCLQAGTNLAVVFAR